MKCLECKEKHNFFYYLYSGASKTWVRFPTCKKCFKKAIESEITEDDICYSDELYAFKIKRLEERIKKIEFVLSDEDKSRSRK